MGAATRPASGCGDPPRAASRGAGGAWLVIGLIVALLLVRLAAMAWVPLLDTTEARYAEIGRTMWLRGDWITPWHDDGRPFWAKPPLSFWLTALGYAVLGDSEFAARLPHFLAMGVVGGLAWGLAARRSRVEALAAVAMLCGATLSFLSAGAVMTDAALVVGTTLAMHSTWLALERKDDGAAALRWLPFVGLAIGLLAKGPLVLVLYALPVLSWCAWRRRIGATWRALPWVRGIALMLVLSVPWYLAAEARTPGFLAYFLIGEHWHRFVTPGWAGDLYGYAHRAAPGSIWLFTFVAALPWAVLVPLALWRGARPAVPAPEPAAEGDWLAYLACWSLAPLLFFTPARNIIWTYGLPAMPALALLAATGLGRRVAPGGVLRLMAAGLALSLGVVLLGGVALASTDLLASRSARDVVAAWTARRQPGEALVFVDLRLHSAVYYSHGDATFAPTVSQAVPLLGGRPGYLVVRHGSVQAPASGDDAASVSHVTRVGAFDLMRVVPLSSATRPQLPPLDGFVAPDHVPH